MLHVMSFQALLAFKLILRSAFFVVVLFCSAFNLLLFLVGKTKQSAKYMIVVLNYFQNYHLDHWIRFGYMYIMSHLH